MKKIIEKGKEFWCRIRCFGKEAWQLAGRIFAGKPVGDGGYLALTPRDDAQGCQEHIRALEWALANPKLKNIALTGPYGSGKSSIIDTFLKQNPLAKSKSIRISMATFTGEKTGKASARQTKLEESILKQIFYKVKQEKIPQSRYRKLHRLSLGKWILWGSILSAAAGAMLFVFLPETFQQGVDKIQNAGVRVCQALGLNIQGAQTLALVCFGAAYCFLLVAAAVFVRWLFCRITVKEVKLPIEATLARREGETETAFNKNLEEILYCFEQTDYDLVFIEDLDRFNDPTIFARLRELNAILNNGESIKRRIVFVYAIRDDLFTHTDRIKFFDFIIPVIPVINGTNSGEILISLLNPTEQEQEDSISIQYIMDISAYISDMRVLNNIYNEYEIYRRTLKTGQQLSLSNSKILSLIIFKNLHPREFADLQAERGIVKIAFENKSRYAARKVQDLQAQLQEKLEMLNHIDEDILKDIKELKAAMLHTLSNGKGIVYEILLSTGTVTAKAVLEPDFDMKRLCSQESAAVNYHSFGVSSIYQDRVDVARICTPYYERWLYLRHAAQPKQEKCREEVQAIRKEMAQISGWTMKELLEHYGSEAVLESQAVRSNQLLVFMLRRGYIDEQYADYMNYFVGNSISNGDMNYILSIKNQQPLKPDFPLSKVKQVLHRLQAWELQEQASLNFDLLEYMLSACPPEDPKLQSFFRQLSNESRASWAFIDAFLDRTEKQGQFVDLLARSWPGFFAGVDDNAGLTYDRKLQYLSLMCQSCSVQTMDGQNRGGRVKAFVEQNRDILQKLPAAALGKLEKLIPALKIQFADVLTQGVDSRFLNYLFDGRHYAINANMLRQVMQYKAPSLCAMLQTQNYTAVLASGYQQLIDYVQENWEHYFDSILLAQANTQESPDAICEILEKTATDMERCRRLLLRQVNPVEDLSKVCPAARESNADAFRMVWALLLDTNRLTLSWENVFTYWNSCSVTKTLIRYLQSHAAALAQLPSGAMTEEAKREILLCGIQDDALAKLLKPLRMERFDIPLKKLSAARLAVMIDHNFFAFTKEKYLALTSLAPELCIPYILKNQDEYCWIAEQLTLKTPEVEMLILSRDFKTEHKETVLKLYGEKMMTEGMASYLSREKMKIPLPVFYAVWEKLPKDDDRQRLVYQYMDILTDRDFARCFARLDGVLREFRNRKFRHDVFLPDSGINRRLAQRLLQVQYITSFTPEQRDIKANRGVHTAAYIRCRVKAVAEKPEPAGVK